ncbi:hypothetical protein EDD40_4353 [Saccharothrix texasensis]|uniref:Uncharacterized protein n=1 Tax=Saccharothrix texasensis TaxID=103734 RepID=A0A3N1H8Y3_9PSEU|nr:hypothetical protein EDD40_4353 [Saccharothrix texasensis]
MTVTPSSKMPGGCMLNKQMKVAARLSGPPAVQACGPLLGHHLVERNQTKPMIVTMKRPTTM